MKNIDKQIEEIQKRINDPDLCFGTASTWTRITGYFRPVENFCTGKKREFFERREYQPFETMGESDKSWVTRLLHGENKTK
jgi:hypothetical protein